MKRHPRHRPLAFEQLESKAAPSSILVLASAETSLSKLPETAPAPLANGLANQVSQMECGRDGTDQLLRFIHEHATGGEHANRPGAIPTAAQCAAADEMMEQVAIEWNSFQVVGFYDGGIEL